MDTKKSPKEIAATILYRSICTIQVGACITDLHGNVISWGWNSCGYTGFGLCSERHALTRCNRKRLTGGTIYVAGQYKDKDKMVPAKPCSVCQAVIRGYKLKVVWRSKEGEWVCEE